MSLKRLLREVRACRICEAKLPLGPRPVVQLASTARLLIVGQAPGSKVHRSGIPWNDPSGDRLRDWLGLDRSTFFDEGKVAIFPWDFVIPGLERMAVIIHLVPSVRRAGTNACSSIFRTCSSHFWSVNTRIDIIWMQGRRPP